MKRAWRTLCTASAVILGRRGGRRCVILLRWLLPLLFLLGLLLFRLLGEVVGFVVHRGRQAVLAWDWSGWRNGTGLSVLGSAAGGGVRSREGSGRRAGECVRSGKEIRLPTQSMPRVNDCRSQGLWRRDEQQGQLLLYPGGRCSSSR
jgi:hypothetical protein